MTSTIENQVFERMSATVRKVARTLTLPSIPERDEDASIAIEPLRVAARSAARYLAQNFDQFWSRSKDSDTERPIGVVDMFSGCGGMSAGFSAVSGLIPSYRLTAAFDIDQVANRTYQANLGIAPFAQDISALARSSPLGILSKARVPSRTTNTNLTSRVSRSAPAARLRDFRKMSVALSELALGGDSASTSKFCRRLKKG